MATTQLNPYLSFRDNAREAIEFYHSVFGGELTINTFEEFGASVDPDEGKKVMHSMITTDAGLALMAADTPNHMDYSPGGSISISLSGDDDATLRDFWGKLSDGGTVVVPLEKAPWGDTFGMCTDKFGTAWLVNIATASE
ncbi:MAG TPA: VOC family protein [Nocardioidaceae bacterium]|nr:VOC family protein [Nocardioidaceae bacterium]